jgi:hypothetical protein
MRLAKGCRKVGPQRTTLSLGRSLGRRDFTLTKAQKEARLAKALAAACKHNEIVAIF